MSTAIIEIQKKAKKEIYHIILNNFNEAEKEINTNYNMGLISLQEKLSQMKATIELALKQLKENNIDELKLNY